MAPWIAFHSYPRRGIAINAALLSDAEALEASAAEAEGCGKQTLPLERCLPLLVMKISKPRCCSPSDQDTCLDFDFLYRVHSSKSLYTGKTAPISYDNITIIFPDFISIPILWPPYPFYQADVVCMNLLLVQNWYPYP